MSCEDFPCCGHEMGCCPDFDASGRQLNMVCVCGAKLPVNAPFSICRGCMTRGLEEDGGGFDEDLDDEGSDGEDDDFVDDDYNDLADLDDHFQDYEVEDY